MISYQINNLAIWHLPIRRGGNNLTIQQFNHFPIKQFSNLTI